MKNMVYCKVGIAITVIMLYYLYEYIFIQTNSTKMLQSLDIMNVISLRIVYLTLAASFYKEDIAYSQIITDSGFNIH